MIAGTQDSCWRYGKLEAADVHRRGPERTQLYNDAYARILARKHPAALGRPILEVWSEIHDSLLPLVEQACVGEPVHMDDISFVLKRRGYPEEAHFSYTPCA